MWKCPNCGERIDDVFDACWKCGTAQDGTVADDFQAEPSDPETPDPRAEPDPPDEPANDPKNERVVELCSAANEAEAYTVSAWLEEAGIRCRIVGDALGNALPLGETTAPRLWVREEDAARAREVIDEQRNQPCQDWSSLAGDVEPEPAAPDAASEESGVPGTPDHGPHWRGRGLLFLGLACIALGAVLAWNDWMMIRKYAATAEGVVVQYEPHYDTGFRPTTELPLQPVLPLPTYSRWYEVQYAFVVNGKTYYSVDRHCPRLVRRVPIHYDPRDPATNIRGSLTSPWSVLAFALAIGGSLVFIGYDRATLSRSKRPCGGS
jgi:hypothetical protein